tara:strand:- start:18 stop:875 length:858 start_codon:yes stop_codon:yes gene_type:complete
MHKKKIKSFAKINLFLNVGKKINKNNLHDIQSLVCLINLSDEIEIQRSKKKKDKISFFGKFSNYVYKKNTITRSISILRNKGFIPQNIHYNVKVNKRIPVFSGLGGGSSNAAYLIKNFIKKGKLTKRNKSIFSNYIGSDLKLFFETNQFFQKNLNQIVKLKTRLNLYFIIVYPFFKSSTKEIYSKVKSIRKIRKNSIYENGTKKNVIKNLIKEQNSLEKIVVSKFPIIKNVLIELKKLNKCLFSRITGSGSACFGVFLTKKSADLGLKKIRKKFPMFWCVVGKTI